MFVCFALGILFHSGCDKNPDDNGNGNGSGNGNEDVYLLIEVLYDGEVAEKYEYDDQNRLKKCIYIFQHEKIRKIITFEYNDEGDLVSEHISFPNDPENDHTKTITKNENIINIGANESIELDAEGLPIKWISVYDEGSAFKSFIWKDGNVIVQTYGETYNGSTNSETSILTYDDKKNPMFHCKTQKWCLLLLYPDPEPFLLGQKNNILTMEDYVTFEYTYNEAGFPVAAYSDEEIDWSFKYEKKK